MNILLQIGILMIAGYFFGWLFDKFGLPKIIGYITVGILFSPNTFGLVENQVVEYTHPLMEVCLGFITFEVGGALRWSKIRKRGKEIISITFLASIFPYLFITSGILIIGKVFPGLFDINTESLILLALLLGALASPTEPAATLAVMRQYKARGKVSDTILGVAALDDIMGILLFSLTIAAIFIIKGMESGLFGNPALNSFYEVGVAIVIGIILGFSVNLIAKFLKIQSEGHWVVVIFSLIILCIGISKAVHVDPLLSSMTMGMIVANKCPHQEIIFKILERYSEELIFLFFFVLSGLYLDISTIPQATVLIVLFIILRTLGKFTGANAGAFLVKADKSIQRYTAGGLLPQGGIVIGLVLSIYHREQFGNISEILLATVMGTMVVHELIGPIAAKYYLTRAGEIKDQEAK